MAEGSSNTEMVFAPGSNVKYHACTKGAGADLSAEFARDMALQLSGQNLGQQRSGFVRS